MYVCVRAHIYAVHTVCLAINDIAQFFVYHILAGYGEDGDVSVASVPPGQAERWYEITFHCTNVCVGYVCIYVRI